MQEFIPGQVEPVPLVLKRKRDEGGVGCERRSESPTQMVVESLERAFLKPEGKKARKRRRRLEREALGRQHIGDRRQFREDPVSELSPVQKIESKPRTWQNQANAGAPLSALRSWPGPGSAFNPYQYSHASGTIWPQLEPNDAAHQHPSIFHNPYDGTSSVAPPPMDFTLPGNLSLNFGGLPPRPPFSQGLLGSQYLHQPLAPMTEPGPSRLSTSPVSPTSSRSGGAPQVPSRPSNLKDPPIGMKPDLRPNSTRGIFHCSPAAHLSKGHPHTHDPERTLVVEQLPKGKRNREFLTNWCKSLCDTGPVHIELDTNRKALLEFESAEVADIIFSSPRFHSESGKAAIRVWRYRVDLAPVSVDEIEEGEIEESDGPQWQKLTKKARKAQKKVNKGEHTNHNQEAVPRGQARSQLNAARPTSNHVQLDYQPPSARLPQLPPFESNSVAVSSSSVLPAHHIVAPRSFINLPSKPLSSSAKSERTHSNHVVHNQTNGVTVAAGGDDDRASIRSSQPGSPLVRPTVSETHRLSENTEAPVSTQLSNGPQVANCSPIAVLKPQDVIATKDTIAEPLTISIPRPARPPLPPTAPSSKTPLPMSLNSPPPLESAPARSPTPAPGGSSEVSEIRNGPDGVRRSLQARQKELEERIARTKLELSKVSNPVEPPPPGVATAVEPTSLALPAIDAEANEVAVEERLRRLVLESKRAKAMKPVANGKAGTPDTRPASPIPAGDRPITPLPASKSTSPAPSVVSGIHTPRSHTTLEELAVSFITEAIQTVNPHSVKPSPHTTKLEMAAKQQWLEQQIAESKLLMAKLSSAQTKQERDAILVVMREQSRCVSKQFACAELKDH